ncbi:MAG: matrixin family metalloprotease [Planctomycetes bacterium]|nr:matrixin family metalloprotease [Planctomycetota bacterium]MCB9889465.1 matrixin family metalloprotease [Planctomycetota bacterium]
MNCKILKCAVSVGLLGSIATLVAFTTYPGSPRWPLVGGYHYIVDLNTTSFPANSVWDQNAQYALSDWRDIGSASFSPGFRRSTANAFVNNDGLNAWGWFNRPADSWLGICYYRYSGSAMVEADIAFNSRPDYTWTNGSVDPCKDAPYWPVDFRGVARHETGHAMGLDHTNTFLSLMNPTYTRGSSVPHTGASGELPHTDDKFGCRFLYSNSNTVYNLMATCWRPNGSGTAQRLALSGTYTAGTKITVPVYIENQSNTSFPANQRLGVYLSTNDIISTGDTRIASIQFSGNWSFHAEQYYTFDVIIPANTPAGTYHVGCIIDWDNVLAERYEGDNAARIGSIQVLPASSGPTYYIPSDTPATGGCNVIPFGDNSGSSSWRNQKYQQAISIRSDLNGAATGRICDLAWSPCGSGIRDFDSITVRMGQTTASSNALSTTFANNMVSNVQTVLNRRSYAWHNTADTWNQLGLQSDYVWNTAYGDTIVVEITVTGARLDPTNAGSGFHATDRQRVYAYGWTGSAPATGATDTAAALKMAILVEAADLHTFGRGCPGSNSLTPTLSMSGTGQLGTAYAVNLSGALPNARTALVLGIDTWDPPIDLRPFGAPGCTWFVSDLLWLGYNCDANGRASTVLTVPNNAARCLRVYFQWFCVDGPANSLGLTTSNYGRILTGL